MVINGVFAMAEIAMVSSRRARLKQYADKGDRGASAALELLETPNRFLSTIQVFVTLVGIFSGAYGVTQLSGPFGEYLQNFDFIAPYANLASFVIVVLLTTYFSLIIGELVPKRIALNNPEAISSMIAKPLSILSILSKPVVNLLSTSSEIGIRLLGVKPSQEPSITEEEIKVLVEQGRQIGVIEEAERDMVSGVFRLGQRRVDALMTPRLEMAWFDIHAPLEEFWEFVTETPHSRIPVAEGNLDNILGYIQTRDLVGISPEDSDFDLEDLIKEPIYLAENMAALRALDAIQTSGVHLAIVIDEFGGITGMVTDYDILEAIVGEIPEDSADTDYLVIQREDGSWLFDGMIVIDQLKDTLGLAEMPGEERSAYQTLSGFVMSQLGRIPKTGAKFTYEGFEFEVVDMDGRRVDRVLVTPLGE